MAVTKELVCLANSRKHGGRCIAGVELLNGHPAWIRPISDRRHHEVSAVERQYSDGTEPRVLDVVSMSLVAPKPINFQHENWLIDPTARWRQVRRITWEDLSALEEHPGSLWINGHHTSAGTNDRIPFEQSDQVVDSLKLIRVESVTIKVRPAHPNAADPRSTVRAGFTCAGTDYTLRVTDPVYEEEFRYHRNGNYTLAESFLTVSLGEEFEGSCYKLVAAIIRRADVDPGGAR